MQLRLLLAMIRAHQLPMYIQQVSNNSQEQYYEKPKPAVQYLESEEIPPIGDTDKNLQSEVELDSSGSENEKAAIWTKGKKLNLPQ
uniref:Uncharacterized protein n=1 Tax=Romanomermis culicivorax TaxID=13658 RepID=A0A915K6S8_ROMCU